MKILPLRKDLLAYLKKHNLERKFIKQRLLFETNPFYPSLKTELLEPPHRKIYSLRIDRKYRALFFYRGAGEAEIFDINNHYG